MPPRSTRSTGGLAVPAAPGCRSRGDRRVVRRRAAACCAAAPLVVIDYVDDRGRLARAAARDGWLRTYREHTGAAVTRSTAPGAQDITADVVREQLRTRPGAAGFARRRRSIRRPSGCASLGIDELVEAGRRTWEARAHIGDLEALRRPRSRVGRGGGAHRSRGPRRAPSCVDLHPLTTRGLARYACRPASLRAGCKEEGTHVRRARSAAAGGPHVPAARRRSARTRWSPTRRVYDDAERDWQGFWADAGARARLGRGVGRRSSSGTCRSRSGSSAASSTSSYNCLDRHVEAGHGDQVAFHWEGEPGDTRTITYRDLLDETCRVANVLRSLGVEKGDRVAIYMGMVPETVATMLACARIGAPHSVVFGGFSAQSLTRPHQRRRGQGARHRRRRVAARRGRRR